MKRRVVFDCMIFLQAAARPTGPAAACIDLAEAGNVEVLASVEVREEMRDLLNRPRVQRKFRTLTSQRVVGFIARVERFMVLVDPIPVAFTLTRDPKDSKYLNLAIAGNAELVVSRDNDLLDLMTATDSDSTAFRTAYPRIRIVDPVAFLQSLPPTAPTSLNPSPPMNP